MIEIDSFWFAVAPLRTLSQALEPLKTTLPQDTETQAAFSNLYTEVTTTVKQTELYALESLLELKASLLTVLPGYVSVDNKLEMAIEAAQRQLGVTVDPASKKTLWFIDKLLTNTNKCSSTCRWKWVIASTDSKNFSNFSLPSSQSSESIIRTK
jgi:hypothetical protein